MENEEISSELFFSRKLTSDLHSKTPEWPTRNPENRERGWWRSAIERPRINHVEICFGFQTASSPDYSRLGGRRRSTDLAVIRQGLPKILNPVGGTPVLGRVCHYRQSISPRKLPRSNTCPRTVGVGQSRQRKPAGSLQTASHSLAQLWRHFQVCQKVLPKAYSFRLKLKSWHLSKPWPPPNAWWDRTTHTRSHQPSGHEPSYVEIAFKSKGCPSSRGAKHSGVCR